MSAPVTTLTIGALSDSDVALLLDALDVAAEYRRYRAAENRHVFTPGEPVPDSDLQRADEYDALTDSIRREAVRP